MSYMYDTAFIDAPEKYQGLQTGWHDRAPFANIVLSAIRRYPEKQRILVICSSKLEAIKCKDNIIELVQEHSATESETPIKIDKVSKECVYLHIGERKVRVEIAVATEQALRGLDCDLIIQTFPSAVEENVFYKMIVPLMIMCKSTNVLVCTSLYDAQWADKKSKRFTEAGGTFARTILPIPWDTTQPAWPEDTASEDSAEDMAVLKRFQEMGLQD